jgi:hypothetical protein
MKNDWDKLSGRIVLRQVVPISPFGVSMGYIADGSWDAGQA